MSNEEFENYVALMGKLLQFTAKQREQISGELQDHLQMRVADLTNEGVAKADAISQALEEFGDAAVMARNFQTVLKLKRRRWMMRFATYSIAGAFLAAILTMAMWPDGARFGTPNKSLAQANDATDIDQAKTEEAIPAISDATQLTMKAEEALRKVVSLNYFERPFHDIEEELEAATGLNFLLTSSATDDSLTADEPLTFRLEGIPLNKALQLLLATRNATYFIDEGVVMIISLDDAEDAKWFRLKMYDCRELVKVLPDTQSLVGLVQKMVQPDTWQDTGQGIATVEMVNGFLVVAQTEAILLEIENFISDLEGNVLQKKKLVSKVQTSSNNTQGYAATEVSVGDPFGDDPGKSEKAPLEGNEPVPNPFGK